jgi:glycosyltransferase involved in cell wall biosynthesis
MKVGFYYHIPIHCSAEGFKLPSYLGLFIDSLANEVEQLLLFMHEGTNQETTYNDYILKSRNINLISLGKKTPAWERFLLPSRTLRKISAEIPQCDIILIRAPSPLAPAFYKRFNKIARISYMVVGDYVEGSKHLDQPWWRKLPIIVLSTINDKQLSAVLKRSKTLVNSQKLYNKYKPFVTDLHLVRTTTLKQNDFYYRQDTCQGDEIRLLYTGSFSFAKGLRELVDAFAFLSSNRKNITLHFVGWDYDPAKPVETYLSNQAVQLGVAEKVVFHGFRAVGTELDEMYRMADIYVIPSYHEGFPRTIWEAMANSLPVIATRVGSIPHFLKDGHDALLIEPQNPDHIVDAVNKIIDDSDLRRGLIQNGYKMAGENTLEELTSKMIDLLQN